MCDRAAEEGAAGEGAPLLAGAAQRSAAPLHAGASAAAHAPDAGRPSTAKNSAHGAASADASLERGAPAGLSEAWWGDGGKGEGREGQGKGQGQGLGFGEPPGVDAEAMPEQTLGQCEVLAPVVHVLHGHGRRLLLPQQPGAGAAGLSKLP